MFSQVSVTSTSTLTKLYRASARQRLGLRSLVTNLLQSVWRESENKNMGLFSSIFLTFHRNHLLISGYRVKTRHMQGILEPTFSSLLPHSYENIKSGPSTALRQNNLCWVNAPKTVRSHFHIKMTHCFLILITNKIAFPILYSLNAFFLKNRLLLLKRF